MLKNVLMAFTVKMVLRVDTPLEKKSPTLVSVQLGPFVRMESETCVHQEPTKTESVNQYASIVLQDITATIRISPIFQFMNVQKDNFV